MFQPRQHCRRLQVRACCNPNANGSPHPAPVKQAQEGHRPQPGAWTQVLAQRKVKKTQQVILKEDVPNIGKKGELTNVINGYWYVTHAAPFDGLHMYVGPAGPGYVQTHRLVAVTRDRLSRRRNYLRPQGMAVPATEGILRCAPHHACMLLICDSSGQHYIVTTALRNARRQHVGC